MTVRSPAARGAVVERLVSGGGPGGGGFVVQRMLARNENHAIGGTLLFNVLHYAVRPWPWILVAARWSFRGAQAEQDAAQTWLTDHAAEVRQYDTDKAAMPPWLREDVRLHRADARCGVVGALRVDGLPRRDISCSSMVARAAQRSRD